MAHTKTIIDWNTEDLYWKNEFRNRPYTGGEENDYWRPAYRYGFEAAERYQGKTGMRSRAISVPVGIGTKVVTSDQPGSKSRMLCVTRGTESPIDTASRQVLSNQAAQAALACAATPVSNY